MKGRKVMDSWGNQIYGMPDRVVLIYGKKTVPQECHKKCWEHLTSSTGLLWSTRRTASKLSSSRRLASSPSRSADKEDPARATSRKGRQLNFPNMSSGWRRRRRRGGSSSLEGERERRGNGGQKF